MINTVNIDQMRKAALAHAADQTERNAAPSMVYCLFDQRRAATNHKDGPYVWYCRPLDGSLGDPCPPFDGNTIEVWRCAPGQPAEQIA